jgi:hypothetical protein
MMASSMLTKRMIDEEPNHRLQRIGVKRRKNISMATVTRRALRVFSALSELRQSHEDILDALIPFFEPILEVLNGKLFDPDTFASAVRKTLRWRFNKDIAQHFRLRLARKGYLKRRDTKQEQYFVTYSPPDESQTDNLPIAEVLASIINEFDLFTAQITELINYQRTHEQLADILIRFLVSLDAYGEKDLLAEMEHLQSTDNAKSVLAQLEEGGTPLGRDDRYMCARFVREISKTRPEYIPHLSRLASIGLLTEVVDDFIKPTHPVAKSDLLIFLDAPIALDFLGCSGLATKQDLQTLYDSLTGIGCSFVVLPITCGEMTANLRSMLKLPPTKRYGQTHATICKGEIREDYVESVARDPVSALKRVGIQVRQLSLEQHPNTHVFFTEERHEDFLSEVTWVQELAPREHDATCLTLLMRLRAGRHNSDILKCGYVFMTRNPQFVERSREYCLKNRLINEIQQGPLTHQRDLFTVAWLRTGLGIADAIPRGHMLATCDHVLQTRTEVRDAVAARLRQIRPDELEQFEVLLADHRCLQVLADQTLNNERQVTTQNVGKLLDIMRDTMVSEVRGEYEKKLEDAQRRVKDLEDQVSQLTTKRATTLEAPLDKSPQANPEQTKTRPGPLAYRKNRLLRSTKVFLQ